MGNPTCLELRNAGCVRLCSPTPTRQWGSAVGCELRILLLKGRFVVCEGVFGRRVVAPHAALRRHPAGHGVKRPSPGADGSHSEGRGSPPDAAVVHTTGTSGMLARREEPRCPLCECPLLQPGLATADPLAAARAALTAVDGGYLSLEELLAAVQVKVGFCAAGSTGSGSCSSCAC